MTIKINEMIKKNNMIIYLLLNLIKVIKYCYLYWRCFAIIIYQLSCIYWLKWKKSDM